jgi:hypothetical protein
MIIFTLQRTLSCITEGRESVLKGCDLKEGATGNVTEKHNVCPLL